MSSSNSRNAKIQESFHSIIISQYNLQFPLKALINISKCIFYLYIKCRGQTNPNIFFFFYNNEKKHGRLNSINKKHLNKNLD